MAQKKDSQMNQVLEAVLKRIKPAKAVVEQAGRLISTINKLLEKNKINAECVAGGSYAKGTILKNDFDIDLFVRFDYKKYKDKNISELLCKAIPRLDPELVHGSRDYFQLKKQGLVYEIVPVLNIRNYKQAVNVTDMSPLHVDYVKKHLEKNPGLADQIRLAKQFCKANNIYGAESYIRGFSGHVLDLLVIYYGSFVKLLMQAAVWGKRAVIDAEKHLKNPLKELNRSKTESPLVIVDPIQPDRNAAAALSKEKFELFKQRAKQFLKKPDESFFIIKKLDINELRARAGNDWLVIVKAVPLKGKDDVVGAKILKCFEHIKKQLKKHEFMVLESGWEFDRKKSTLYFIIKKQEMPDTVISRGPPVKEKQDAERFGQKHQRVFEKNKRLFAEEKRAYKHPLELARDLMKNKYIKQRVKNIKTLKE